MLTTLLNLQVLFSSCYSNIISFVGDSWCSFIQVILLLSSAPGEDLDATVLADSLLAPVATIAEPELNPVEKATLLPPVILEPLLGKRRSGRISKKSKRALEASN